MKLELLLQKLTRRTLLLSFLIVAVLATACGLLREFDAPQPTPLPRPGVPLTPTPWFGPANYATEAGVTFDDRLRLLGYTVEPRPDEPGSRVSVTLIWQVLDEVSAEYNTFVHALNEEGQLLAQSDQPTGGGRRQSTGWLIDEYVYDQHQLQLPRGMDLDDVQILIGLYDFAAGQRADGGGRNTYVLDTVATPTPFVSPTRMPAPTSASTTMPSVTDIPLPTPAAT